MAFQLSKKSIQNGNRRLICTVRSNLKLAIFLLLCTLVFFGWEPFFPTNYQQDMLSALVASSISDTTSENLDNLFFDDRSRDSIRAICDRLDDGAMLGEHARLGNPELFDKCMLALERGQSIAKIYEKRRGTSEGCPTPQVLIHSFWVGNLPATAKLGLLSTIYAHPPGCAKLRVWTMHAASKRDIQDKLRSYLGSHFDVSILNITSLYHQILQNFPRLRELFARKREMLRSVGTGTIGMSEASFSDLVRVLVLAAYGGVYVDCDVLILNPITPLLNQDFYYRWSTQSYCNTAIFHIKRGSPNAEKLIIGGIGHASALDMLASNYHPQNLYQLMEDLSATVEMLPSAYFDPNWAIFDSGHLVAQTQSSKRYGLGTFHGFFDSQPSYTSVSTQQFFPGSFTYHWHSKFNKAIHNHSVAAAFINYFEFLKETQQYL